MSKAFIQYTLFREGGVDDLLSSLFIYLSNEEVNMMKSLIAEESVADDFSSDEFYEVLEQFKAQSLVKKSNAKINLLRNLN